MGCEACTSSTTSQKQFCSGQLIWLAPGPTGIHDNWKYKILDKPDFGFLIIPRSAQIVDRFIIADRAIAN